jgi:Spy/CpxP family protein refolding chaperone
MGGGMMCGQMGGQMGCMTGDQKGGMKCDHKGMMGGHMGGGQMGGGMMCDHQGGMGGQMGGMMCDHQGGMMGGHKGGMMGHHGAGMMMGSAHMHMIMSLDLSDEQRSKINKLSDELKHNNWATKGSIMDESAKLRDLYAAEKRDPSTIGKQYQKIFDLEREMIEATIAAQNRIEEILTADQRAQLKSMRQGEMQMHDHPMH